MYYQVTKKYITEGDTRPKLRNDLIQMGSSLVQNLKCFDIGLSIGVIHMPKKLCSLYVYFSETESKGKSIDSAAIQQ